MQNVGMLFDIFPNWDAAKFVKETTEEAAPRKVFPIHTAKRRMGCSSLEPISCSQPFPGNMEIARSMLFFLTLRSLQENKVDEMENSHMSSDIPSDTI